MTAKGSERLKVAFVLVTFSLAAAGFIRFYRNASPGEGKAYFYDLSGRRLFTAPHSSVPPIKGVVGDEEDGVRAIVISTNGNCADTRSRQIVYLETYTPELKQQVESRKKQVASDPAESPSHIRRGEAHAFILVKRPEETGWHPMTSPQAQKILQVLSTVGPDGKMPLVCVP